MFEGYFSRKTGYKTFPCPLKVGGRRRNNLSHTVTLSLWLTEGLLRDACSDANTISRSQLGPYTPEVAGFSCGLDVIRCVKGPITTKAVLDN